MNNPFRCTSCGAQNEANVASSCAFCGIPTMQRAVVIESNQPMTGTQSPAQPPALPHDEGVMVGSGGFVCLSCGSYISIPGKRMPGNLAFEVALYFFYLIPGLFYSAWRRNDDNAVRFCVTCDGRDLAPILSIEGQDAFRRKYGRKPLLR